MLLLHFGDIRGVAQITRLISPDDCLHQTQRLCSSLSSAPLLLLPVMETSRGSRQAHQQHQCFSIALITPTTVNRSNPTAPTEAHLPHIY